MVCAFNSVSWSELSASQRLSLTAAAVFPRATPEGMAAEIPVCECLVVVDESATTQNCG